MSLTKKQRKALKRHEREHARMNPAPLNSIANRVAEIRKAALYNMAMDEFINKALLSGRFYTGGHVIYIPKGE